MEKSTLISEMFTSKTRYSKTTKHKPSRSAFETMDDYLIGFLKYWGKPITLTCLKENVRTGKKNFVEEYKAAMIRLEQSGIIFATQERPTMKTNKTKVPFSSMATTGRPKTIITLASGYDQNA